MRRSARLSLSCSYTTPREEVIRGISENTPFESGDNRRWPLHVGETFTCCDPLSRSMRRQGFADAALRRYRLLYLREGAKKRHLSVNGLEANAGQCQSRTGGASTTCKVFKIYFANVDYFFQKPLREKNKQENKDFFFSRCCDSCGTL